MPKVEVKPDGPGWSVYVDGKLYIEQESYIVAHGVAWYIDNPNCADTSELSEVAQSIARSL